MKVGSDGPSRALCPATSHGHTEIQMGKWDNVKRYVDDESTGPGRRFFFFSFFFARPFWLSDGIPLQVMIILLPRDEERTR